MRDAILSHFFCGVPPLAALRGGSADPASAGSSDSRPTQQIGQIQPLREPLDVRLVSEQKPLLASHKKRNTFSLLTSFSRRRVASDRLKKRCPGGAGPRSVRSGLVSPGLAGYDVSATVALSRSRCPPQKVSPTSLLMPAKPYRQGFRAGHPWPLPEILAATALDVFRRQDERPKTSQRGAGRR